MKDVAQRVVEALGRAWSESHGIEEDATARGRFILREGLHEDHAVSVSARDLVELIREASKCDRLQEHAKAVEANRDELWRLLMDAHQIMAGPGTTDQKLRKSGHLLGLLNPHRTKEDWDAMADHYWKLRFGVPPLSPSELEALKTLPPGQVDRPREPMSQQDAEMEMERKYGRTFDSIIKGWQNQNEARRKWNEAHKDQDKAKIRMIEVKTGKRHPTYKDTLSKK